MMEKIIGYLLAIPLIFGLMMLEAWVVMMGWGWFVVPLGVPAISIWESFGICAFVSLLFGSPINLFKDHELDGGKLIATLASRPSLALFLMYFAYRMAQ